MECEPQTHQKTGKRRLLFCHNSGYGQSPGQETCLEFAAPQARLTGILR